MTVELGTFTRLWLAGIVMEELDRAESLYLKNDEWRMNAAPEMVREQFVYVQRRLAVLTELDGGENPTCLKLEEQMQTLKDRWEATQ